MIESLPLHSLLSSSATPHSTETAAASASLDDDQDVWSRPLSDVL